MYVCVSRKILSGFASLAASLAQKSRPALRLRLRAAIVELAGISDNPEFSLAFDFPPHRRRGSDGRLAHKLDFGKDHGAQVVLLEAAHARFSTVGSSSRSRVMRKR